MTEVNINPDIGLWTDIEHFRLHLKSELSMNGISLLDFIVKKDVIYGICSNGTREFSFGVRMDMEKKMSEGADAIVKNMLEAFENSPDNVVGEIGQA